MANYNKAFNFRNGVQVDVDKFIVRGSLVGIGTSIPGEIFDVNGNVRVAGLVTTRDMNVTGVATFNQVRVGSIQLSASAGVITATAFYGDGATLSNLPTSQWVDVDVGLGFTSIYAAGNVGVNTLDPRFSLQVGANPLNNLPGVGINSNGNIISTGIISARSFSGIGAAITSINAENITAGTLPGNILPIVPNDKLGPNLQLGIITATDKFYGDLIGYANTARNLQGDINILVGFVTTVNLDVGIISAQNATVYNTFGVGIGSTVFYAQHSGKVGLGSTSPAGILDINARLNSTLNVISRENEAKISVGQSNSSGVNAGILRYGNPSREFDIINRSPGSMNFILHNGPAGFGTGIFNWRYGQTSQDLMSLTYDGKFGIGITNPTSNLHVVGTSTFTDAANFGGQVNIYGLLNVSAVNFGSALNEVNINTTSGISTFYNLRASNNIFAQGIGINTTALSPNVQLDASTSSAQFSSVSIGTVRDTVTSPNFQVNGASILYGGVGIGTIKVPANSTQEINIYNTNVNLYSSGYTGDPTGGILFSASDVNFAFDQYCGVGIGTTDPRAAFDLSAVGRGSPGQAFMILPKLSPAQRTLLSPFSGGLIYNTTNNAGQLYNGTSWQTLTHTDGNSANAGFSTFARWAGISTIASVAGFATNATRSGVSSSTVSTTGVVDVNFLDVTGISTFVNGPVTVGTGITINSGNTGVITARGGFASGIGTAATQIYVSGNRLVFNVVGIGSTSFILS